ncbi:MAG: hypothetical protein ACXACI_12245 [Candidatus Hodarchaeales archaeon]|jgi:hypothetical protein
MSISKQPQEQGLIMIHSSAADLTFEARLRWHRFLASQHLESEEILGAVE